MLRKELRNTRSPREVFPHGGAVDEEFPCFTGLCHACEHVSVHEGHQGRNQISWKEEHCAFFPAIAAQIQFFSVENRVLYRTMDLKELLKKAMTPTQILQKDVMQRLVKIETGLLCPLPWPLITLRMKVQRVPDE